MADERKAPEPPNGTWWILGALALAPVVLKLGAVIDWSWWWVFAPAAIGGVLVLVVGYGVAAMLKRGGVE